MGCSIWLLKWKLDMEAVRRRRCFGAVCVSVPACAVVVAACSRTRRGAGCLGGQSERSAAAAAGRNDDERQGRRRIPLSLTGRPEDDGVLRRLFVSWGVPCDSKMLCAERTAAGEFLLSRTAEVLCGVQNWRAKQGCPIRPPCHIVSYHSSTRRAGRL